MRAISYFPLDWISIPAFFIRIRCRHFVWNMDCGNFIWKKNLFPKKTRTNSLILFKWDSCFGSSCHFNVDISIFPLRQLDYVYVWWSTCFYVQHQNMIPPIQGPVIFQNRKLLISFPVNLNLHGHNVLFIMQFESKPVPTNCIELLHNPWTIINLMKMTIYFYHLPVDHRQGWCMQ